MCWTWGAAWGEISRNGCGEVMTRYVGVDIAKASLEQFSAERLQNIPQREKVTHLICADLGTESLTSATDVLRCTLGHLMALGACRTIGRQRHHP